MTTAPPETASLLDTARGLRSARDRIAPISTALLGRPYAVNPLGGGPHQPEVFVDRLDAFDCVTYVESVYALAFSEQAEDYPENLRALRYLKGRVRWRDRNHYIVQWIRRNRVHGFGLVPGAVRTGERRTLNVVSGVRSVSWTVAYLPTEDLDRWWGTIRAGDLMASVSTQPHLDAFHTGLLFPDDRHDLIVRHASQGKGAVVDEPIDAYIVRAPSPGFIVARLRRRGPLRGGLI